MALFGYPVIIKPWGSDGIEYWFPDFEECEHIYFQGHDDESIASDMAQRFFKLYAGRVNHYKPLPKSGSYAPEDGPFGAQLRFLTVDTNSRSGCLSKISKIGEENMRHGLFDEIPTGTPTLKNESYDTYSNYDAVNHPQHYTQSGIECIDAIDSLTGGYERPGHGYYAGQVLKYLWRAPFKGHYLQDLEKAQWYLNRLVKKVQDEADHGN